MDALGHCIMALEVNSALGLGRKIVKFNAALERGTKINGLTKTSDYFIIGIEPSVCHGFGPDLDCRQLN